MSKQHIAWRLTGERRRGNACMVKLNLVYDQTRSDLVPMKDVSPCMERFTVGALALDEVGDLEFMMLRSPTRRLVAQS
jgi:hypothetical protein